MDRGQANSSCLGVLTPLQIFGSTKRVVLMNRQHHMYRTDRPRLDVTFDTGRPTEGASLALKRIRDPGQDRSYSQTLTDQPRSGSNSLWHKDKNSTYWTTEVDHHHETVGQRWMGKEGHQVGDREAWKVVMHWPDPTRPCSALLQMFNLSMLSIVQSIRL